MTELERFDQNARSRGILVDTDILVLLVVGSVNRDRIPISKRTSVYTSVDWDLLIGILGQIPTRYTVPHVLAEANALTDMKGPELDNARSVFRNAISLMRELEISSVEACASPYYWRLGLTDAAIALAAEKTGCSVLTDDSGLYVALVTKGISVSKFDNLRQLL